MKKNKVIESYKPIELFHWAGISDNVENFKNFYLKNKEIINYTNHLGDNALIIAIRQSNINIVKYLIEETKIKYKHNSKDGNPLFQALYVNNLEIFDYLIKTKKINLKSKNHLNQSLYHLLAEKGLENYIDYLIENKINMNVFDSFNQNVLFYFIDGYAFHKNYLLFEKILQNLTKKTIKTKNIDNLNIIDYIDSKIEKQENLLIKNEIIKELNPLKNILTIFL